MLATNHLRTMLDKLIARGQRMRSRMRAADAPPDDEGSLRPRDLLDLAHALLSERGQSSGVRMATEFLDGFVRLDHAGRHMVLRGLASEFGSDRARMAQAWQRWQSEDTQEAFTHLARAVEPPRQELFRRLNLAPSGTAALVAMRAELLAMMASEPDLRLVDDDLFHLLQSWFNRGFLVMRRIDWSSPADLLERIIRYEAVHSIANWNDLRDRLAPEDRRCYAFFHPAMADEPLIFVEIALANGVATSIQDVLKHDRPPLPIGDADTAIFYSISNCQAGLAGISFGHFLIKQVAQELSRELPRLVTFVTLSPLPHFARWVRAEAAAGNVAARPYADLIGHPDTLAALADDGNAANALRRLALDYLANGKDKRGRPIDPVARFHLGNGARLERLCWMGDRSTRGLGQSAGFMVNYLYDLPMIEENHEAFAREGRIATGEPVRQLAHDLENEKGSNWRYGADNLHDLPRPQLGRAR